MSNTNESSSCFGSILSIDQHTPKLVETIKTISMIEESDSERLSNKSTSSFSNLSSNKAKRQKDSDKLDKCACGLF